jgi:nitroreductase
MQFISTLIRARRACFPKFYIDKAITQDILLEILENARWAPSHKRTEPWRFTIFHSPEARQKLSDFIAEDYKTNTPSELYTDAKMKDLAERPKVSGCAIAICMQRDPKGSVPEWEEYAAVAMAVQNIWLSCTAFGIGSYWSTPGFITRIGTFLKLPEGQKCVGLFYMGYYEVGLQLPAQREPLESKLTWI